MEPVTCTVGGREMVASGVVHMRDEQEIVTLKIAGLVFNLQFETSSDGNLNVTGALQDNKELTLTLVNFNNPLGSSYWAEIGQLRHRSLTVDLFVHAVGERPAFSRLISYSFCLAPEVTNG